MKKSYLHLFLSFLSLISVFSTGFAEKIDGKEYKNFDTIEKIGYFYSPYMIGNGCGGGYYDARFVGEGGLVPRKEFSDFFKNLKFIGCKEASIGVLSNLPPPNKIEFVRSDGSTSYANNNIPLSIPVSEGNVNVQSINKTSEGEFLLLPSVNLIENIKKLMRQDKSQIEGADGYDINQVLYYLQGNALHGKQMKISGKFYKIKGKYTIEGFEGAKSDIDIDTNIIMVNSLDFNIKTNSNVVNDATVIAPDKITKPAPIEQKVSRVPAVGFKIITEKQKASLQRQIEKFTEARIYAIAEKIDGLLRGNTISDNKRNLLKDVLYMLYITDPSDGGLSRSEIDRLGKIFTTDKSDAFESLLQ